MELQDRVQFPVVALFQMKIKIRKKLLKRGIVLVIIALLVIIFYPTSGEKTGCHIENFECLSYSIKNDSVSVELMNHREEIILKTITITSTSIEDERGHGTCQAVYVNQVEPKEIVNIEINKKIDKQNNCVINGNDKFNLTIIHSTPQNNNQDIISTGYIKEQ